MELKFTGSDKDYDYEIIHPKHEEVKFFCRAVQSSKEMSIFRKHSDKKSVRGNRNATDFVDIDAINFDKFDYAVVDWEGMTVGGEEFPCTPENKRKFYKEFSKTLVVYITEEIDFLMRVDAGLEEGN